MNWREQLRKLCNTSCTDIGICTPEHEVRCQVRYLESKLNMVTDGYNLLKRMLKKFTTKRSKE
ncbi:hypothetical protein LCGC14_2346190 [marine sediment metagenome]|uniref:Uncharacterized protein n=1 Tax=marine sediment metagenome TaxID=412755 RepID=A0A0F9CBE2_9ZZZZ